LRAGQFIKFTRIGAGAALRSAFSRDAARKYLVESLLEQTGIPAKIGQMIAMRAGEAAPGPAPRLDMNQIQELIERESPVLAPEIDSIHNEPHVASLSQVHRAKLKSGEDVAIKIQFPGLGDAISQQVDDFLALAAKSPAKAYGFSSDKWAPFLRQKFLEELDYRQEARQQQEVREHFAGSSIVVPRVFEEFSTDRILVQQFEASTPVTSVRAAGIDPSACASLMVSYLEKSLFTHRLIHCDLNPGNYGFRNENGSAFLVLYDFGSMQRIETDQAAALADLVLAAHPNKADAGPDWMSLLGALGFDATKLASAGGKIDTAMRTLLAPFGGDKKWDPAQWHPGREIDRALGDGKWWFRMAGPPWFLYLMRTVQGWHYGLRTLDAPVDTRILQQSATLAANHRSSGSSSAVSRTTAPTPPTLLSTHLRVKVTEGAETVVEVEMPAAAIENLADLVPDDVVARIKDRGIDLVALGRDLAWRGAPPGTVFEETSGPRRYRVWLVRND
jgi:hypothetical protein